MPSQPFADLGVSFVLEEQVPEMRTIARGLGLTREFEQARRR